MVWYHNHPHHIHSYRIQNLQKETSSWNIINALFILFILCNLMDIMHWMGLIPNRLRITNGHYHTLQLWIFTHITILLHCKSVSVFNISHSNRCCIWWLRSRILPNIPHLHILCVHLSRCYPQLPGYSHCVANHSFASNALQQLTIGFELLYNRRWRRTIRSTKEITLRHHFVRGYRVCHLRLCSLCV